MASIKVKFSPSTNENKEGTIYYQIIQNRVIRQLKTDYRLFTHEWNEESNAVIINNNSRQNYLQSIQECISWDIKRLQAIINQFENKRAIYTPMILSPHSRSKVMSNRCSILCRASLLNFNKWVGNAHLKPIVAHSKVLCNLERTKMCY